MLLYRSNDQKKRDKVAVFGDHEEDQFTTTTMNNFIRDYKHELALYQRADNSNLYRHSKSSVAHLWVTEGSQDVKLKTKGVMASVRQFAQQYHRDLILVVHDEKRDEGKAVVGTNVSNAVATALAPYGLDGAKRPLFALESFLENEKESKRFSMMEFSASTTPVELSAWADKVFAGEVTQAVRSEPVPNPYENKVPGRVRKLVGTQLADFEASGAAGLVYFYQDPGVPEHHAVLEDLAGALHTIGSSVKVHKFHLDKNAVAKESILAEYAAGPTRMAYLSSSKQVHGIDLSNATAVAIAAQIADLPENASPSADGSPGPLLQKLIDLKAAQGPCGAVLYQHGDFTGWRVRLPRGTYDAEALIRAGAKNDDLSSVKVDHGCRAFLYEHSDLTGWKAGPIPAGSYAWTLLQTQAPGVQNDKTSAVVVQPHVVEDQQQVDYDKKQGKELCQISLSGTDENVVGGNWTATVINGRWNHTEMAKRGALHDHAAQATVPEGCTVTVWENTDFTGASEKFEGAGHIIHHTLPATTSALEIEGVVAPPPEPEPVEDGADKPVEETADAKPSFKERAKETEENAAEDAQKEEKTDL